MLLKINTKKEVMDLLIHTQCGCAVKLSDEGKGKCSGCGKKIKVRISNK